MERDGQHLFRWRSHLPLALLPIAAFVFPRSAWMAVYLGKGIERSWDRFCLAIALLGLLIRVMTAGYVATGSSGRNTRSQTADELNTTGLYSLVRHPLYVGNFLIFMSFVMLLKDVLFVLFAAVAYALYYERIIMAEESFLLSEYGDGYRRWASRTALAIPNFTMWVAPARRFSWKVVLRREAYTFLQLSIVFFLVELAEASLLEGRSAWSWAGEEPIWLGLVALGLALLGVVWALRRFTNRLAVTDR